MILLKETISGRLILENLQRMRAIASYYDVR